MQNQKVASDIVTVHECPIQYRNCYCNSVTVTAPLSHRPPADTSSMLNDHCIMIEAIRLEVTNNEQATTVTVTVTATATATAT
jgi:hypothetical protein